MGCIIQVDWICNDCVTPYMEAQPRGEDLRCGAVRCRSGKMIPKL